MHAGAENSIGRQTAGRGGKDAGHNVLAMLQPHAAVLVSTDGQEAKLQPEQ